MCQQCLKEMANREQAGKPFPILVSAGGVAVRSSVGSYVPGLNLTREERNAVRDCTAWVVFHDSKARAGWRVVIKVGWGYYFRTPPPDLLERLQRLIPDGTPPRVGFEMLRLVRAIPEGFSESEEIDYRRYAAELDALRGEW